MIPRRAPHWFIAWFAFCALLALGSLVGTGWLIYAVISWLNRH